MHHGACCALHKPCRVQHGTLHAAARNTEPCTQLKVAKHPLFAREGANVHVDVPVTLSQALLGATVRPPPVLPPRVGAAALPPSDSSHPRTRKEFHATYVHAT